MNPIYSLLIAPSFTAQYLLQLEDTEPYMYFCLLVFLSDSRLSDKRFPLAQISLQPLLRSRGIPLWRPWSTAQKITALAKTFSWLTFMSLIIHSCSFTKMVLSLKLISWTIFFFFFPFYPHVLSSAGCTVFVHSGCVNEESCYPVRLVFDFTGPCVFPPSPLLCFTGHLELLVNVM